ncbi:MAG: hypothetical protein ACLRQF_05625 [Thomasclavelia ramosa]
MKQTGCDIHAIGDGGFGGCTWPENIYQLSVSIKGKIIRGLEWLVIVDS